MIAAGLHRTLVSPTDPANEVLNPAVVFAVRTPDGKGAIRDWSDGTSEYVKF